MQRQAKKVLILSIAGVFIAIGFIGLVLPFLQGILFLAIGFLLLSLYFPKLRTYIERQAQKSPHFFKIINKIDHWILRFIGEI